MTITVKVSDKTMKEMNEFYDDFKRVKTPPYALFQADDADCVVTVYTSGKAVFQGKTADLSSKMWIEMEQHNNPSKKVDVKNSDDKKKEKKEANNINFNISSIGSDEVGTGDFFGPIVVAAAFVKKEQINELAEMGVKDSKKLTDVEILELVPKFINKIDCHIYIMTPEKYNEVYNQDTMNMNKIKAILHNNTLNQMVSKHLGQEKIIVDQFCSPKLYYKYLEDSPNALRNITFITKGEDHSIAVACASLISRYTFLKEFDKLSDNIGIFLPKGAGEDVDKAGLKIAKEKGIDKLKSIAKLNFKNMEKIKKEM